ncbi:MAG: hypothetical protein WBB37_01610 [bacterium]
MIEGLVSVLILSFLTLIFGITKDLLIIIIPQVILILIVIFLLVRVRVKISKAEKEKLRSKIDELEDKIGTIGTKQE